MTPEQIIGAIVGLTVLGGLLVSIGKWVASREHGERIARDQTRTEINRLGPLVREVLDETRDQSKTLAVLVHQADGHSKRLEHVEGKLDEHGNRITRLEERQSQP